jgi:endonuclease YncB( thermonuclease family)
MGLTNTAKIAVALPFVAAALFAGVRLFENHSETASAAVTAVAPDQSPQRAEISGVPIIVDGDTIKIDGRRIRFFGMDAPESAQLCGDQSGAAYACGDKATSELRSLIGQSAVACRQRDTDRYGRAVAVCFVGSEDLSAEMVRKGWALAYRHYSLDYVPQEDEAHYARVGMWVGHFEAPWDWRHEHKGGN